MAVKSVSELATQFGVNTAVINQLVVKQLLPLVSDNPRKIDEDACRQALEARTRGEFRKPKAPPVPKAERQPKAKKAQGEVPFDPEDAFGTDRAQLMLWNKRTNTGWAVGMIDPSTLVPDDDYVETLNSNLTGVKQAAMISSLKQEFQTGKLYFANPAGVLAILVRQLETLQELKPGVADIIALLQEAQQKVEAMES